MKVNRFFLGALATGLLFSCANDENEYVNGSLTGEVNTSYIAVNVNSAYDVTRADYAEGTAEEQAVNTAHFFFFDNAGSPFAVSSEIGGNGYNYIVKSGLGDAGENPKNVETITNAVLTIKSNKGANPAKVVAVVNWDYAGTSLALADLKAELVAEADAISLTDGFLMSNSVYLSGADVMDATPITAANIATTEIDAVAVPVDIYVERLAAKVTLTQDDEMFDTGVENPYVAGTNLHAKVLAWDINTTLSHSNLVKTIQSSWTDAGLGITGWSIEAFKRSFWAQSAAVSGSTTLAKQFSWNGLANVVDKADYCLENTSGENTKVLVKAQIVDADENPVTIVKFLGEYITIDGLKNSVAAALASKYYTYDGASYTSIAPEDLDLVTVGTSGADSYSVVCVLNSTASANVWKVKNGDATYSDVTADNVNAALAALAPAQIWNNGMAYYFTDIRHLGAEGTAGEFGVVRNHSYGVNIQGIKGLGTPVYDGDNNVDEPVTPSDTESYIAARVNVLTWKLVNSNVILK